MCFSTGWRVTERMGRSRTAVKSTLLVSQRCSSAAAPHGPCPPVPQSLSRIGGTAGRHDWLGSAVGPVHDERDGLRGVASAAVLRPSANWLNESVMSGIVLVMRPDSGPLSSPVIENSVPPGTSSSR
jgi:hypothetical protein